jgi:hypothetical protein
VLDQLDELSIVVTTRTDAAITDNQLFEFQPRLIVRAFCGGEPAGGSAAP